jgi:[ribosomal protein S5]-alanine N-acetyltransferase
MPDRSVEPLPSGFFLQTERLGFRCWSDADLDLAMGVWGDPEVTRLIGGPFSRAQVGERLAGEIATMRTHGVQYWPVFLLATGDHVGCCGLRPYETEERIFEVGIHLRKEFWGQGYAPEATRAVMAHAFETLGAAALFAGHHPANDASRRVLETLGFRYTHDEHYPPTGLKHPSYLLPADEYRRKHRDT